MRLKKIAIMLVILVQFKLTACSEMKTNLNDEAGLTSTVFVQETQAFTKTPAPSFTVSPTCTNTSTSTITPTSTATILPTPVQFICEMDDLTTPESFYRISPVTNWFHQVVFNGWKSSPERVLINQSYYGLKLLESDEKGRIVYITDVFSNEYGISCPKEISFIISIYEKGRLLNASKITTNYGGLFLLRFFGSKGQLNVQYSPTDNTFFLPVIYNTIDSESKSDSPGTPNLVFNFLAFDLIINYKVDFDGTYVYWDDPDWCNNVFPPFDEFMSNARLANGTFVRYTEPDGTCPTATIEDITDEWIAEFGEEIDK